MLFWLLLPRECSWLIKNHWVLGEDIKNEQARRSICWGPLGLSDSNSEKYWATFKELQIAWYHAPGDSNCLDGWLLDYRDSYQVVPKLCWGQLYDGHVRVSPELETLVLAWRRTGRVRIRVLGLLEGLSAELVLQGKWRSQSCSSSPNSQKTIPLTVSKNNVHLWEILIGKFFSWGGWMLINK